MACRVRASLPPNPKVPLFKGLLLHSPTTFPHLLSRPPARKKVNPQQTHNKQQTTSNVHQKGLSHPPSPSLSHTQSRLLYLRHDLLLLLAVVEKKKGRRAERKSFNLSSSLHRRPLPVSLLRQARTRTLTSHAHKRLQTTHTQTQTQTNTKKRAVVLLAE